MQTKTTISHLGHTPSEDSFPERDSIYVSARKVDENRIELGGVIFYENCNLKALRKYSREHNKKTSSRGLPS